MCFFSKPKAPEAPQVTTPAAPAPTPVITPSEVSPQTAEESRRKRLQRLRSGLASTIKTSPTGIENALYASSGGKTSLGA